MRVFQSSYRDRNGQTQKTNRWYIEFSDHLERPHRLPGLTDRRQTEALGRRVLDLVGLKAGAGTLPPDMSKWVEGLPARIHRLLGKWGLLDTNKVAALRPLADHLDGAADLPGWRQHLAGKGNTAGHVDLSCSRVKAIIDGCKFAYWSDLSASRVLDHLAGLQADRVKLDGDGKPQLDEAGNPIMRPGLSAASFNYYLAAFKGFCRWMVRDGRASESPVAHLDGLNAKTDRRHDRRALDLEEIRWLLDVTAAGPIPKEPGQTRAPVIRHGMSGEDRAMLYRLAIETGLRAGELRSLTRASFNLDAKAATVTVAAGYSKRRREDTLPLRAETAAKLVGFMANKLPDAPAFNMPKSRTDSAGMFKADLADARAAWIIDATEPAERQKREQGSFLAYQDAAGRFADFHALRHATGSLLAAAGVHPKTAQSLMRHSTIELTMSRYSHVFAGQEAGAIAALPDLAVHARKSAVATGTNGPETVDSVLPVCLALSDGKATIPADSSGQITAQARRTENPCKPRGSSVISGGREAIAGVAELADAPDSKSGPVHPGCGFDSLLRQSPFRAD